MQVFRLILGAALVVTISATTAVAQQQTHEQVDLEDHQHDADVEALFGEQPLRQPLLPLRGRDVQQRRHP